MATGTLWLLVTISHAKNDDDLRESEAREAFLRKEFGIFHGRVTGAEQFYRATYRHPVLMRLPGVILVAAAFLILLVENLQLALLLVEVSGLLIAAALVVLLVEKLR